MFLLAACAPTQTDLPTLVSSPTLNEAVGQALSPSASAQNTQSNQTSQDAEGRATLPASFTPTFTASPTPSATASPTPSVTPSATITDTPSPTPTDEPTLPPEARPLTNLLQAALEATLLPTDFAVPAYQGTEAFNLLTRTPTGMLGVPSPLAPAGGGTGIICNTPPVGGFAFVYSALPDLQAQLGCPASPLTESLPAAWQSFQNGTMIWLNGEIYVLYGGAQTYAYFADSFQQGIDAETSAEVPPVGLLAPVRGFLKVWANNPTVRGALGWATAGEVGTTAIVLRYGGGLMLALSGRGDIFTLVGGTAGGVWRVSAGQP